MCAGNLGGRESGDLQGRANSVSKADGVSDMVPACWLCGCRGWVPQEGGQWPLSRRKLCPSSCLDARHFRSSLYVSGAFQATPQCWGSEGMSLCKSMCGFFKRNCLGLQKQKFLPLTQSLLVFATKTYGDLSSWH